MIIELFGLPGAGKSTLAQRLEGDGFEIVSARNKRELLRQNVAAFFESPGRFLARLWSVVAHSTSFWMFRYKFANLFLHYNAKHRLARKEKRALVDQGHLQGAISLFEKSITETKLLAYLKSIEPPDLLVVLDVPEERMHERIRGRSYIVRKREGEQRFRKRLTVMRKNYSLILATLPKLDWNFVVVSAALSPDEVYAHVRAAIHEQ